MNSKKSEFEGAEMKPTKEYLRSLLEETEELAKTFDYSDVDVTNAEIRYLATKKYNWLGLHEGIASRSDIKAKRSKFSEKIHSNCRFYNKFFYIDGKLMKVEGYVDGHDRMSTWYKTFYIGNKRYLYPGGSNGENRFGYIFVTEYRDGRVYEEYMVDKTQIVFWRYCYSEEGAVESYFINYVPTGKYPVISESEGIYDIESLEYKETYGYSWYQDNGES